MSHKSQEPAQPPPCDPRIYREGIPIFSTYGIRPSQFELWVRKIATLSEQPVDWHFAGGRACVLACGDVKKARKVLIECLNDPDAPNIGIVAPEAPPSTP